MNSTKRRTNAELHAIWKEYESGQYNNNNEWKNHQITFQHWFNKDWRYTTKKVQVFCQICMNDGVDMDIINQYILQVAIYYNDNYI